MLAGPVEGALASQPELDSSGGGEPLREIPGLRRRERTWRDEVRERVRQRKQQRAGGELPLFPEEDGTQAGPLAEAQTLELGEPLDEIRHEPVREREESAPGLDLPLHPPRETRYEVGEPWADAPLDEGLSEEPPKPGWPAGAAAPAPSSGRPVERPAAALERAEAAALDVGLLIALWVLVVYFASRAAHVTVAGLLPSWPAVAGYLAALGLLYAGYFTGTTGQTLGKIALGLRVVDAGGQPPGYLRASLRALLGCVGVLLAGGALVPMAFDPARRALHDRLLKTRVVRG